MTRDYGGTRVVASSERDPAASETVLRLLDRSADITTRYGGRFVQSINGLAGTGSVTGRRSDWFFYVNGIESSVGAADVRVRGGDRIWWDYRDWTAAMRVPAVVGSWPEPFRSAKTVVDVDCFGEQATCAAVAERLRAAGARPQIQPPGAKSAMAIPRVLVGPWANVRRDGVARTIESGPDRSGVFAQFGDSGPVALDQRGNATKALSSKAGLIAALRDGDKPATWVVTGADDAAVRAAAKVLDETKLQDRYAVAADRGRVIGLPVP